MKKFFFVFIIFLTFNISSAAAETVTLETYIPSPFGMYDRLRLVPKSPQEGEPCDPGTFYVYDDSAINVMTGRPDILMYCGSAGTWGFFNTGGVWMQEDINGTTAYIYPRELAMGAPSTVSVGIGIATPPAEELHVVSAGETTLRLEETVNGAFTQIKQLPGNGDTRFSRTGTGGSDINIQSDGDIIFAELTGANVGIGTAAPISKLDVNGDIRLLPDATWRGIYWGTDASAPRLRGNSTAAAMLYQSGHDTVTELSMRDKQDTVYGRLRGSGDGRYFGLLDGTSHWFLVYDDDAAQQNVQLRSGTTDATRMRVYGADTGGGRIDVRIGGPGAVLDDLRFGYVAAAPSGYYAVLAP